MTELEELNIRRVELLKLIEQHGDGTDVYELEYVDNRIKEIKTNDIKFGRNEKYGNAWLLTGLVTKTINREMPNSNLIESGLFYVWDIILCKMMRAITSPKYDDNWIDTKVYAEIVAERFQFQPAPTYRVSYKVIYDVLNTIEEHTDNPNKLHDLVENNCYLEWRNIMDTLVELWLNPQDINLWIRISEVANGQIPS